MVCWQYMCSTLCTSQSAGLQCYELTCPGRTGQADLGYATKQVQPCESVRQLQTRRQKPLVLALSAVHCVNQAK